MEFYHKLKKVAILMDRTANLPYEHIQVQKKKITKSPESLD